MLDDVVLPLSDVTISELVVAVDCESDALRPRPAVNVINIIIVVSQHMTIYLTHSTNCRLVLTCINLKLIPPVQIFTRAT